MDDLSLAKGVAALHKLSDPGAGIVQHRALKATLQVLGIYVDWHSWEEASGRSFDPIVKARTDDQVE